MKSRPIALVTGAGRGIGAVIASELGTRGYDVALHYWDNEDGAKSLAEEIQSQDGRTTLIKGDLTLDGIPKAVVEDAKNQLGPIDVLVNNAGVTLFETFLNFEQKAIDYTYKLNFLAPYLCAQSCAKIMIQEGIQGTIVNITSVHYERSTDRDSAYGSMKSALARATESMANELAPYHIRVNAVAPGRIRTSSSVSTPSVDEQISAAIPLQRSGTSKDIANAVAWLISPESSYVTGTTVRVDGGLNLPMQRAMINGDLRFI